MTALTVEVRDAAQRLRECLEMPDWWKHVDRHDLEAVLSTTDRIEHLQSEIERKDAEIEALRIAIDLARARECRCPKPLPPGCYGNAALTKDQQQ